MTTDHLTSAHNMNAILNDKKISPRGLSAILPRPGQA